MVKFKEPIVKFIFVKPRDVKVASINGQVADLRLEENPNLHVYDRGTPTYGQPDPSHRLKQTVFEGSFNNQGKNNTLYIIL